ncbi:MAG: NADP-dependent phosphogluconate dehydrogenase [Acidobacteria bacterium]|nr:MAG: NADP-dependent phosphogluconate dehydrogenase [Acidobacteriota bacterium]REK01782.1 MAG: NADP-dependent phosphogluconate dehydrogenase [Acidobacteriota bacterium]REK14738.1 MAG: NADP-dependent phosphogluconate dehydrogenase [Acidobacteriota bacterium]REK45453.1 MAG: NADP-dependent phosphogluconate dehydrogenase [Acidobacteriota bacterium]
MENAEFGMVGLGTMGRNFLLNVAEQGFTASGYDLDPQKTAALNSETEGFEVEGFSELGPFLESLAAPRKIMLLVPAGKPVDSVISALQPHLAEGDIIIDGGNSHFPDTERRMNDLSATGLGFLGTGVSGGAEGARNGPSIMSGGDPEVYSHVKPVLEAVSAKVNGEPCAARVGSGSAGHFVKMVHNGIEYGMMQLICEVYDILSRGMGISADRCAEIFAEWDSGELNSFLIEITAKILAKKDDDGEGNLVDKILDTAGQKGTGRWTSEVALEMGVPIPTIDSAVTMRQISSFKERRIGLAEEYPREIGPLGDVLAVGTLRKGLFAAYILTYAQGMSLLTIASKDKNYGLDIEEIAKIWRGGCIIRASLLEDIRKAFAHQPDLQNLILHPSFKEELVDSVGALREVTVKSMDAGLPSYCFASCLAYFDAFTTARLPVNLLQGQRDFFGAHTYQRTDKEGTFTSQWDNDQ